jgi:hypothetical protein
MSADNLLRRAQLLASSGRLLVRTAKMERDQKASKQSLAPTCRKLDEVLKALAARKVAMADARLKEARIALAAVKLISLPRRVSKRKMH